MDFLEVGAVEIGRNNAPDRHQHRQEVLKHMPATLVAFLRFHPGFLWPWEIVGGIHLWHMLRCCWGVLKDKLQASGF